MPKKFYAVRKPTPNIYNSWDEASKAVTGVPGAVYKSFNDYWQAHQFAYGPIEPYWTKGRGSRPTAAEQALLVPARMRRSGRQVGGAPGSGPLPSADPTLRSLGAAGAGPNARGGGGMANAGAGAGAGAGPPPHVQLLPMALPHPGGVPAMGVGGYYPPYPAAPGYYVNSAAPYLGVPQEQHHPYASVRPGPPPMVPAGFHPLAHPQRAPHPQLPPQLSHPPPQHRHLHPHPHPQPQPQPQHVPTHAHPLRHPQQHFHPHPHPHPHSQPHSQPQPQPQPQHFVGLRLDRPYEALRDGEAWYGEYAGVEEPPGAARFGDAPAESEERVAQRVKRRRAPSAGTPTLSDEGAPPAKARALEGTGGGAGAEGNVYTLAFDGGSRGNPGLGGSGAVLYAPSGEIVAEVAYRHPRPVTCNVAEYTALIKGLEAAIYLKVSALRVRGDSMLVIRQMQGQWRVKAEGLVPLYERARALEALIDHVSYEHVLRAANGAADLLANAAMDDKGWVGYRRP